MMPKEEYMADLDTPPEDVIEEVVADDVVVAVVDDTPPEDRNKAPLVENPEPDEDELASYSDRVKKRISTLQRAYHDERRAKEVAAREAQEALRYAQSLVEQNKSLVQKANTDSTLLHDTWKAKAESDLAIAKRQYKEAYESGDADQIIDAQEALNRATLRHETAITKQAPLQQEFVPVKSEQDVYTQPAPDRNAVAWTQKNPWFGKDRQMTSLAYGVHEDLVSRGVHPERDADYYYRELDKAMRTRFPEYEWSDTAERNEATPRQPSRPAATVVAPVTRSSSGKKVALTQTQVAIAKRLNIPLAEYAKQVAALQGAK
jgi:hypothetical protein